MLYFKATKDTIQISAEYQQDNAWVNRNEEFKSLGRRQKYLSRISFNNPEIVWNFFRVEIQPGIFCSDRRVFG